MSTTVLLWANVPFAALTLFVVATIVIAALVVVSGKAVPDAATLKAAPWWSYSGGFIVAFYVFTITFLSPRPFEWLLARCHLSRQGSRNLGGRLARSMCQGFIAGKHATAESSTV